MRWNMRMKAAERGIWKSTELRRVLADAGLEISAGKMSALWTGTPTSIRLDDLDVICSVLDCTPADLLLCEPDKVAARRVEVSRAAGDTSSPERPSARLDGHPTPGSQPFLAPSLSPSPRQPTCSVSRAGRWPCAASRSVSPAGPAGQ